MVNIRFLTKPLFLLKILLSLPPIITFSGLQNQVTNERNETIGGNLKQLEESDTTKNVSITTVKMKQMEEIGVYSQSPSIKVVKMRKITASL